MSASKSFELALDYLFENRNKYNNLAPKYKLPDYEWLDYGFTNAYGELINNLKIYLVDKVSNIISNNIVFNKPIIGSLCMSFQGSCNENYKTAFYTSLVNDLDTYPDIIKESIIDYCNIFNNDIILINDKTDIRIIKAYFVKLLIPVFYIFTINYDNSLDKINELNKITKDYNIEIKEKKYMNYYTNVTHYYNDILNIFNQKNNDSFKIINIINILETYSREYNIINNDNTNNKTIDNPMMKIAVKKIVPSSRLFYKQNNEFNLCDSFNDTINKSIIEQIIEKPNRKIAMKVKPIIEVKPEGKTEVKEEVKPSKDVKTDIEINFVEEVKPKKKGKEKIPVAVRKIVWNTYIGKDNVKGKCLCCNGEDITSTNFECGHVKSEKNGGEVSIDNLRPICSSCNKSMGTNDMDEFMTRYKIKKPKNWNGIV